MFKSVKIWQNYGHESVAPLFLAHPVEFHYYTVSQKNKTLNSCP